MVTEIIDLVKVQKGKDENDVALVAPDQVKEWETKGYKVVKAEEPKGS